MHAFYIFDAVDDGNQSSLTILANLYPTAKAVELLIVIDCQHIRIAFFKLPNTLIKTDSYECVFLFQNTTNRKSIYPHSSSI